jgi:hypothetical protein
MEQFLQKRKNQECIQQVTEDIGAMIKAGVRFPPAGWRKDSREPGKNGPEVVHQGNIQLFIGLLPEVQQVPGREISDITIFIDIETVVIGNEIKPHCLTEDQDNNKGQKKIPAACSHSFIHSVSQFYPVLGNRHCFQRA